MILLLHLYVIVIIITIIVIVVVIVVVIFIVVVWLVLNNRRSQLLHTPLTRRFCRGRYALDQSEIVAMRNTRLAGGFARRLTRRLRLIHVYGLRENAENGIGIFTASRFYHVVI